MNNYKIITESHGEGTFGTVAKAKHLPTNTIRALKQIPIKRQEFCHGNIPKQTLREMRSLQQAQGHENIIHLHEVFAEGNCLVLAMEFLPRDLSTVLKNRKRTLPESCIKSLLLQTLRGVAWCHKRGLMHRDLKPANLLISNEGKLKIADFGLATIYRGKGCKYSHQVATRWYRAPELLYGSVTYDFAVDMYAVGCIFSELLNNCPLFPGNNDIDQLTRVLTSFGNPDERAWPGISKLPDYNKISFPKCDATPLSELIPDASSEALDLLEGLLYYDPEKRISVEEALKHEYFFKEPLPCHERELARELGVGKLSGTDKLSNVGGVDQVAQNQKDEEGIGLLKVCFSPPSILG